MLGVLPRHEAILFYGFTLINLLPVVLFEAFPTVDGPSHLYNSRVVHEMLFHNDDFLAHYYAFN